MSSQPRDYYFYVAQEQVGDSLITFVYLTNASYFDREHAQSDWELTEFIGTTLEGMGLEEEMEGVFSFARVVSAVMARNRLIERGFRESPSFSAFMASPSRRQAAQAQWSVVPPDDPPSEPWRPESSLLADIPEAPQQLNRSRAAAPTIWERLTEDEDSV